MQKFAKVAAIAALVFGAFTLNASAAEPKHSMEDIMKKGLKGKTSLLAKALGGTASKDDLKLLVDYCKSLEQHKPDKGSAESWKEKTAALTAAAQKVADGGGKDEKAALKKASHCKNCHNVHKGK